MPYFKNAFVVRSDNVGIYPLKLFQLQLSDFLAKKLASRFPGVACKFSILRFELAWNFQLVIEIINQTVGCMYIFSVINENRKLRREE